MVLYECHVPEESSDLYFAHHAKGSLLVNSCRTTENFQFMTLYNLSTVEDDWFEIDGWLSNTSGDAAGSGERCYSPNMPPEWSYCLATNTWAWVSKCWLLPMQALIPTFINWIDKWIIYLQLHCLDAELRNLNKCSWIHLPFRTELVDSICRGRLKGFGQVWWVLLLLLLTTSAWACLQHSHHLPEAF